MELLARVTAAANQKRVTDQLDNAESMLFSLARMVEVKDKETGDHCSRLEHMATVFGKALGLNSQELIALRRGSVLHDIGKIGISDKILLKNGPLTEEEWIIMREHTVIGGDLCSNLKSMRLTAPSVRHHHERWDGSGYPNGFAGEEIPYLARVFQIIDIYDALASKRPYKEQFSTDKIISIFEQETAKGWRDPELVSAFLNILRERPQDLPPPDQPKNGTVPRSFNGLMTTASLSYG